MAVSSKLNIAETLHDCNATSSGSSLLPILSDELIAEILLRIPVKLLLKFRCVCKSWKSLISDPHFVKKHLCMSTIDPNSIDHRIMLISERINFTPISCSVSSLYENPSSNVVCLSHPLNGCCYRKMAGSCDGLLCLAISDNNVLLWNPTIGVSKKLPCLCNEWKNKLPCQGNENQSGCFTVFGFGYDHLIGDYKVVAVFCYVSGADCADLLYKTEVMVCALCTNSWRGIQEFPYCGPCKESGKFVSGCLIWIVGCLNDSSNPWKIISLDLGTETYQEVLQPDHGVSNLQPTVGVLRDCLCITYNHFTVSDSTVWLMKEYGVKDSWTRLVTVPYFQNPEYLGNKPLFISENGEVLMQFARIVVLYNPSTNSFRFPGIQNNIGWIDVVVYVESLVSP
ncbi:F-box/kelch-repeat protein [Quillaja saponaria]|uniref:F-box/kelch-repeat protein n=1 Tax=Quillaja saponaria TaxID=32244 RepID=A0AAD7VLK3_QUISA|nr:F-box/kelch-repeat protein [Quillaja saponaria]